jgi:hypothetical protein
MGVLVTRRGWRAQDWIERTALDLMQARGPQTGDATARMPAYAGFPWSAYLDSLERPDSLEAVYLRTALRTLGLLAPRQAGLVTVCQHPDLPVHLDRLAEAGVTDVFWTGALPDASQAAGITLHPFPALPAPDAPGVEGEGPEAAFAFCTAEAGGNTTRLWKALSAGLIPVLPVAQPVLPGHPGLWQAAAVLHDGTDDTRLFERLAAIAASPAQMDLMRLAGESLNLIYGPGRMIHDVLECLLARQGRAAWKRLPTPPVDDQSLLHPLILRLKDRATLTDADATLVLQQAATDLLCLRDSELKLAPGPQSAAAWRLIANARAALGSDHPEILRFDAIVGHLRDRNRLPLSNATLTPSPLTPVAKGAAMRVHLLGPRGQRTPISYAPMRPHLGDRIAFVDQPDEADLIVTGWNLDLKDNRETLAALVQRDGGPRLVVMSEEPLWDTLWSDGPTPRDRMLDCGGTQLPYRVLNHVTSDIFAFRHLPWFILSADHFPARYATLISEFAALTPRALLQHWLTARWQAAFVAERRLTSDWAAAFPAEGMAGMSVYRSRVAELAPGAGILRLGLGWPGTTGPRQNLPDWHLDKLARLHGKVRICGAHENTLHRDYVTEKPFDAFAVGAIPAVIADPGHRLLDLVLPEAMLNTSLASPEMAAARIASFVPDLSMAEAWRETAQGLLARFRDTSRILEERQRIADACVDALRLVLQDRAAKLGTP